MFTYADLSKTGHDHFLFNTGYFTILKNIFPEDEVAHYSHPSHFKYIRDAIDLSNLTHHPAYILKKNPNKLIFLLQWIYKNIYDFFILFPILRRSAAGKGRFVFFAMMPVRSMAYLLFWHRIFFRRHPVILTFHGEIEAWFAPRKNFTKRFHSRIFKALFAYRNDQLKFFVPNAFIRENLRQEPRFRSKDILSVYHLLHPQYALKSLDESPIILAHIGSAEQRKNSDCFFRLASLVQQRAPALAGKLQFKLAGKYNPVFDPLFDPQTVVLSDQQRILERAYFDEEIATAHFSVIFIYPDEYLYRESGTVLESLKFCKPIIGLRHPYLDFLEQKYGRLGIYGNTTEEVAEAIKSLLADRTNARAHYDELVTNIQNMHRQITLPALAAELAQQMRKTGMLP